MDSEYYTLRKKLKDILNVFRLKVLLYNLMKGSVYLFLFLFVFLFLYRHITFLFPLSVVAKAVAFYSLLLCIIAGCLYFIVYPVYLYFKSSDFRNDILLRQLKHYLITKSDILISVYHLAFHKDDFPGNEQLKEAAFIQKYDSLEKQGIFLKFPGKLFRRSLFFFIGILILVFFHFSFLTAQFDSLRNYESPGIPPRHVQFILQNENLEVEYGKGISLKLQVQSENQEAEHVFICLGGGEFLMTRQDSVFVYSFEVLNNDLKFCFKALEQQSEMYEIKVLPTPVITDYKVIYTPPAYTTLRSEILKNIVDFRVLFGSTLKFELNCADLDSLYLEGKGRNFSLSLKNRSSADFSLNVRQSGEYTLYGSNVHFKRKSLLSFNVVCIPDLYPGIQVTEVQDSMRSSLHYFYGVITDDYGFTELRFNYSVHHAAYTVVPINIAKNTNTQEFYFSFDFAEFGGMDKSEVSYFFEIFDNDNISGPKSTRSEHKTYEIPDLNTIFDYNTEANFSTNSALNEAKQLAQEIVKGVKDLQRKMLEDNEEGWEKQQMAKDIIEKKNKLEKLLNAVKEENWKKSDLNTSFTGQDSVLLEKQQQIQDLLDKIMDDEMKNLLKEFSELSEEFSKEKFKNMDEKMKLSFDQMSEKLDRNIELLKRFQIEEQHDLISQQLNQLKVAQKKWEEMTRDKSVSRDSLSHAGKSLQNDLNKIKENYEHLLKQNQELDEPYSLNDLKKEFGDLDRKLDEQHQNVADYKKNKDLSEEIRKDMENLSEKLEQQKNQNFMDKSLPENQVELIIQNILIISLTQEDLLKQFPEVESQSLKYNELGRLQDLKRQEYKIVKDSLSEFAKSNLSLASLLSQKFYDIEVKFNLLPQYIQDNKRSDLAREQQYIVTYLNDMALTLIDALQKAQQEPSSNKNGRGGKQKKGNGKENPSEGYDRLKDSQNGLKNQLQELISRMKKGEKGKPLQEGISNIIRQNELFRKSLNDFISRSGSMSNQEKQLLNEINQLLEENIRDIANYSLSGRLIERNNQIFNKLLMSEKASKEKEEFEEKRRAETAKDFPYERPEIFFHNRKKNTLIKTDFQKTDLKLNTYFKILYNNYYIKLGNE